MKNELTGFGRYIRITGYGQFWYSIGWWDDGLMHGYGRAIRQIATQPITEEGLFDLNYMRPDPTKIRSYDIKNDSIAKKIDWNKYLVINQEEADKVIKQHEEDYKNRHVEEPGWEEEAQKLIASSSDDE